MAKDTMDWRDDFDKALDRLSKSRDVPAGMTDAAAYVNDTLELAWVSARSIFGKAATPDVAIAIYDRIAAEQKERAK